MPCCEVLKQVVEAEGVGGSWFVNWLAGCNGFGMGLMRSR